MFIPLNDKYYLNTDFIREFYIATKRPASIEKEIPDGTVTETLVISMDNGENHFVSDERTQKLWILLMTLCMSPESWGQSPKSVSSP